MAAAGPKAYRGAGSSHYHLAAQHLPPGASTVNEFSKWPEDVLSDLFGPAGDGQPMLQRTRQARLLATIGMGVILHSDFSGKQCPETMFRMMSVAMADRELPLPNRLSPLPWGWFVAWRACDIDPTCQMIMRFSEAACMSEHLFHGMVERLPPQYQNKVPQSVRAVGTEEDGSSRNQSSPESSSGPRGSGKC